MKVDLSDNEIDFLIVCVDNMVRHGLPQGLNAAGMALGVAAKLQAVLIEAQTPQTPPAPEPPVPEEPEALGSTSEEKVPRRRPAARPLGKNVN